MFLVLKRFPMDDVPIGLCRTKRRALTLVKQNQDELHATPEQEDIAGCDVGSQYCGTFLIVKFSWGKPVKSWVEITR